MRYIRWNQHLNENQLPVTSEAEFKQTRLLLTLELIGLVIILLSAAFMARGIGMG
jgi:putative membrane protein